MIDKKNIASRLRKHLAGDGTMNDSETDALYRKWHGIPESEETDLEAVEQWAFETANRGNR